MDQSVSVRQAHKHATMVKRWTQKNCRLCMPILWYCFLPSVHTGLLSWYRLAVFLIVDCLLSSEVSPATRWATKQFCCNVVVHRGAKRIIDSSTVHEQACHHTTFQDLEQHLAKLQVLL